MDVYKAIQELVQRKKQLDLAISNLEALLNGQPAPKRSNRGRKSMPEQERQIVSERMRRYWESRRNGGGKT